MTTDQTTTPKTLTISHNHTEGTRLTGSQKHDGVYEIVSKLGFRHSRTVGIYVRASRDHDARMRTINLAVEALRAAGHTVTVDIDNTPRTAQERRSALDERADERADALSARAERAAGEADRRVMAAQAIGDGIPFGQPVQPSGHHSRPGHLRALDKMDGHMRAGIAAERKAAQLADRAAGTVANAEHRNNPRAILRRIEKLEADIRRYGRELAGYTREQTNGRGQVIDRDVFPPASGGRADDLRRWESRDTEEVAHLRSHLADREASGEFNTWTRDHFRTGDLVYAVGRWLPVRRVNAKSVSVPGAYGTAMTGDDATWNETVTYDRVYGRRRDGMQWDTPNGDPWPVELADKVTRWTGLVRSARLAHQYAFDSPQACSARHAAYAQRIVHGLDLAASDAQVEAIADSITAISVDDLRALAAVYVDVHARLQAGETVPDIIAATTPLTGTPEWELPTDRQPEDVRVDQLTPGMLVAGVWDRNGDGRVLRRGFCGPVQSVSDIRDRREAGDWVTVALTTGNVRDFPTYQWAQAYRPPTPSGDDAPTGYAEAADDDEPVAEDTAGYRTLRVGGVAVAQSRHVDLSGDPVAPPELTATASTPAVADAEPRSAGQTRACLVELAARLADTRNGLRRSGPDVELFAYFAVSATMADIARMSNRLRAVIAEERALPRPDADPVPAADLNEIWDAPVRTWKHQGVTSNTFAVALDTHLYLETWQRGPYENPEDMFGTQVIARADTPGLPPVYAVFWSPDGRDWVQVTGELTGDQMAAWDGTPLPTDARRHPADDMSQWLDSLTGAVPAACDDEEPTGWAEFAAILGGTR